MMTPESVCAERGIDLVYFDGRDTDKKGIYNKHANIIAVDAYLDEIQHKKVIYHEMGHE
ncbi:TPA: ImmA/IrrE family metallo-endopeptidase, partial [Streptococcus suis]